MIFECQVLASFTQTSEDQFAFEPSNLKMKVSPFVSFKTTVRASLSGTPTLKRLFRLMCELSRRVKDVNGEGEVLRPNLMHVG